MVEVEHRMSGLLTPDSKDLAVTNGETLDVTVPPCAGDIVSSGELLQIANNALSRAMPRVSASASDAPQRGSESK